MAITNNNKQCHLAYLFPKTQTQCEGSSKQHTGLKNKNYQRQCRIESTTNGFQVTEKNSHLETDRIRFSKAWISTDSGPSPKRSRRNPVRLSNARNALFSLSSRGPSLTRACVRTKNRWVLKLPNGSLPYPMYNLSYPGVVNTQSGSNFVITDQ
jgi:hypothetical protein